MAQDELGQEALRLARILSRQQCPERRIDKEPGADDVDGHEHEAEVDDSTEQAAGDRGPLVLRRGDALEDVLLRDRADRQREEGGDESQPFLGAAPGPELELSRLGGYGDDLSGPTRHVADEPGDHPEADDYHDRLEEISHGNGPHPAPDRVGEYDDAADDDSGLERDGAARQGRENEAECGQLRRGPAEIGDGDDDAGTELHGATIALAVEVADGEQVHAVEGAREEKCDDDQADGGPEGIGDNAAQPAL